MKKLYAALFSAALVTGMAVPYALSHSNGRELRRGTGCDKLPIPERNACTSCVSRSLPHHYHPDYPPGARCRPDNGKP